MHGEASSFLLGLLDHICGPGEVSLDRALQAIRQCHSELERRFLVNAGGCMQIKVVDKEGCRTLMLPPVKAARPPARGEGETLAVAEEVEAQ